MKTPKAYLFVDTIFKISLKMKFGEFCLHDIENHINELKKPNFST